MTLRIVYDASSRANSHVPSLNVSLTTSLIAPEVKKFLRLVAMK